MRDIWLRGFVIVDILCTRLTGVTKIEKLMRGKLWDFTEMGTLFLAAGKLTVAGWCDIIHNCYIDLIKM